MNIEFVKVNPTQNMTILVNTPVERKRQQQIATSLMAYDSVFAEQTGFIEPPEHPEARARLQMAGGEFCGNASMSLAAYLIHKEGHPVGSCHDIPLEVSGAEGILRCRVSVGKNDYLGKIRMPVPRGVERHMLSLDDALYTATMVLLPGITHIIIPAEEVPGDRQEFAKKAVEAWQPLITKEAFGILLLRSDTCYIDPLVYVKPTRTMVWERGCGSGTAAVGAYLAHNTRSDVHAVVSQPGGSISVWVSWGEDSVQSIQIEGKVRIAAEGVAYVPDIY